MSTLKLTKVTLYSSPLAMFERTGTSSGDGDDDEWTIVSVLYQCIVGLKLVTEESCDFFYQLSLTSCCFNRMSPSSRRH